MIADDPRSMSWEANARAQFLAVLATTPAQRLAWLEEMIDFAVRVGATRVSEVPPPANEAHT